MSSEEQSDYDEERLQELEQYRSLQTRLQHAEALMKQQKSVQVAKD
jgi:hypothetical protein